jgi:rRNA maturation protein Nop10
MKWLKKCRKGGHYLLADFCSVHAEATINPHPPNFNPKDRNGEYRRKAKGMA